MSRDTLRKALLRIFDITADRPDVRAVVRAALEAEPVGLNDPEPIANETESGYARRRELVAEARRNRVPQPEQET